MLFIGNWRWLFSLGPFRSWRGSWYWRLWGWGVDEDNRFRIFTVQIPNNY